MTVTKLHPTKVGQRIQEPFADGRGWVTAINDNGEVVVDWDDKHPDLDDQVGYFQADELLVVEVITVDADHFIDPSLSPLVEQVSTGTEVVRYKFKDGTVAKGIDSARSHLLATSVSDRA